MSKAAGIALSIIGGIISIVLFGFLLLVIYPEFLIFGSLFILIFQTVVIIGGIISILGGIISIFAKTQKSISFAWITILIGAILGGGNILSIIGAVQIKRAI
ncbi:MAG: hypothetical protein ACFFBY_08525 [Promethearchaeota archaeon]